MFSIILKLNSGTQLKKFCQNWRYIYQTLIFIKVQAIFKIGEILYESQSF